MVEIKLSPKTIKAQQELSNKFGIPTFTTTGKVSTVPTSGKINQRINVGKGSFSSTDSFNRAVASKIEASKIKSGLSKKPTKKPASVFQPTQPSKATVKPPQVLSQKTIDAQQRLSNEFGIPTFDLKGGISTIPRNLAFSNVNVGFGKFRTEENFVDAVVEKANESLRRSAPLPTGGGGGSSGSVVGDITNFFTELFTPNPVDVASGAGFEDTGLGDESSSTLDDGFLFGGSSDDNDLVTPDSENDVGSFIDDILNDPVKLGVGLIAVVGLVLATSGGGKKRRR
jgi:hypothetical protein